MQIAGIDHCSISVKCFDDDFMTMNELMNHYTVNCPLLSLNGQDMSSSILSVNESPPRHDRDMERVSTNFCVVFVPTFVPLDGAVDIRHSHIRTW